MKRLLICAVIACFAVGCQSVLGIPDEDEIIQECQDILDEQRPEIVDEIRNECSALIDDAVSSAIDDITNFCTAELQEVKDWCSAEVDRVLDLSVKEVLEALNCVEDSTAPLGWTCNDTKLCPAEVTP